MNYKFGKKYTVKNQLVRSSERKSNDTKIKFWKRTTIKECSCLFLGYRTLRDVETDWDYDVGWIPTKIIKTQRAGLFIADAKTNPFYVESSEEEIA